MSAENCIRIFIEICGNIMALLSWNIVVLHFTVLTFMLPFSKLEFGTLEKMH